MMAQHNDHSLQCKQSHPQRDQKEMKMRVHKRLDGVWTRMLENEKRGHTWNIRERLDICNTN